MQLMKPLKIVIGVALASTIATQAQGATDCRIAHGVTAAQAAATLCEFDHERHRFAGSPVEQARCLTTHVKQGAEFGGPELPAELAALVGKPLAFPMQRLRSYLEAQHLEGAQLGGEIASPLAATYFIIHDTSSPNCSEAGVAKTSCPVFDHFPADRDQASWSVNRTFGGRPRAAPAREANVYVNRVGASVTEANFADRSLGTTKFEYCQIGAAGSGDFVGVESIQPRLSAEKRPFKPLPPGGHRNDSIAPSPGFTDAQYDRLALLYVVASARHGSWMIPAYHAVIDHYFADQHDDPQHFEITKFSVAVRRHLARLIVGKP